MSIEEQLEKLMNNFSYKEFINLLDKIDKIGELNYVEQQILFSIMKMTNDNYIVDGIPGTLGHMLLEKKLIEKEKITPSLLFFFLEEQLEKIAVKKLPVIFRSFGNYKMSFSVNKNNNAQQVEVVLPKFDNITDVDEYNYELMYCALHEIVHAYQQKCSEFYLNAYEKRVGQDYLIMDDFITNFLNNSTEGNFLIHESFVSEQEADNMALSYMLYIAKQHPEYFNPELIKKLIKEYNMRFESEYYSYPYDLFDWLLDYTKNYLINCNQLTDLASDKLENLKKRNHENKRLNDENNAQDYNIFLGDNFSIKNTFHL